jgi:hypothetical protein
MRTITPSFTLCRGHPSWVSWPMLPPTCCSTWHGMPLTLTLHTQYKAILLDAILFLISACLLLHFPPPFVPIHQNPTYPSRLKCYLFHEAFLYTFLVNSNPSFPWAQISPIFLYAIHMLLIFLHILVTCNMSLLTVRLSSWMARVIHHIIHTTQL